MSKEDLMGTTGDTPPVEPVTTNNEPTGIQIEYPENFPEEFRDSPTIMKFVDKESGKINYGNALSSLVHAQKLVGADKIMRPSATATDDDWKNVFHKLGNPEKVEEYQIKIDGFNSEDPFAKGFIEAAHGAGILPKQAEKIVSYFNEANEKTMQNKEAEIDQEYQEEIGKLKSDWGDKFDSQIKVATSAFQDIFSNEEQEYYKEKGLLSDPVFVRAMNKVGQTMLDDKTLSPNEETNNISNADALKLAYAESYAIVAKGDRTNPSFEYHRKNLHKLNERAGQMGVSLI